MVAGRTQAEDGVLAEAVRRLAEALQPDRIYLFGSRARGDATDDSDYDFLVVVSRGDTPRRDQERMAYHALRGLGVANNVLFQTSASFERNLPVVSSLAATVEREGRLLYGEPPPRRAWDPMEVEQQKASLVRDWLTRAKRDIRAAEGVLGLAVPLPGEALYHCQQAYEKSLKGFLTWHDWPLRKTHVLSELLQECEAIDPQFRQLASSAQIVSPYAWKSRYPQTDEQGVLIEIEPTDDEAAEALRLAREAFDFVVARLPAEAQPAR